MSEETSVPGGISTSVIPVKPMSGFLQDADGNKSSKRMFSAYCFLLAGGIAIYGIATGLNTSTYVTIFASAGLGLQGVTAIQGR